MPLYDFKNIETDEIEEHMVKISDYDQFVLDNPHLTRQLSAPMFSYDNKSLVSQAGSEWNDVLKSVKSGMPEHEKHKINTK